MSAGGQINLRESLQRGPLPFAALSIAISADFSDGVMSWEIEMNQKDFMFLRFLDVVFHKTILD